jgi:D-alanyl-D-alanine carboxypeptidase (penicillin-binding protein 5/6)
MAYGEPVSIYRSRPRPTALALVLAAIAVAAPLIAAAHLLVGKARPVGGRAATLLARAEWPPRGQAAIVLGGGRPAASLDEEPAPIASLGKVMTAYLTLERYPLNGDEDGFEVTVTPAQAEAVAEEDAEGQSTVAVAAGERLSERQLLEALLIPSGNNIARLLAARIGGSEAAFVREMNEEARALGMDHTTYTDPSGFDPGTVSTAADQLRVFRRATRFAALRRIVSTGSVTLPVAGTVTNFNPLLAEGFAGKTGSDSAAGGCLAVFTRVDIGGRRRTAVGVVMGQGEGDDTASLLAAAGEAAEGLVDAAVSANHLRNDRKEPE